MRKNQLQMMGSTWYSTAATLVKTEGARGLYRGVTPTLAGAFPYEGATPPEGSGFRV